MLKKIMKRVTMALAAVVALAAMLALYVELDGIPRYRNEAPAITVEATPARVARGARLATMLCRECHEDAATGAFTGKRLADMPKEFGVIWSKNITRHAERGVGRWTDGELEYFLRTGVRPDGQYVPPYMMKLPHLADEDLHSIVAFLRSDDPRVAASDRQPGGVTQPSFLTKALAHGAFGPLPFPKQPIVAPPRSDKVAFGRYMAFMLDCWTCHSADFKTMNVMEPEKTPGYFGGGNVLADADGAPVHAANLTPDDETGIGTWSEADFVRALTKGFRPDGRVLSAPMLPKPELEEEEAAAIYAYLRTVPKIRNAVKRPADPAVAAAATGGHPGKAAYERYGCRACHGETGGGSIADLRAANEHYPTDDALRAWIEDAPAQKPGTKMPAWKGIIKDEDYAPLMAYVRALSRPSPHAAR